jgi:GH24 family phage-related lysozyme (muramidase)
MKIIEILKLLIQEQEGSDPKNPDVYPDQDEWGMDDAWTWDEWKIYYESMKRAYGESKAKKRFLKYWEVVEEGTSVVADNNMEPSWFKERGMWNDDKNRAYTVEEYIENLSSNRGDYGMNIGTITDKIVNYVAKKEGFVPCVYDDKYSHECIKQSLSKNPDWTKCCGKVKQRTKRTTIGYGTTYYPNEKPVMPGDKNIDRETAKKYLKVTLNKIAGELIKLYPKLKQHQLDALTSLCYNVGLAGCTTKAPSLTSALKKDLNPVKNPKIRHAWLDWELPDRRAEEFRIYKDAKYPTT